MFCHEIIQVDIDGESLSEDVSEAAPSTPPLPDEVQAMADAMASASGDLGTDDDLISPRVARPVCLQGEDTEAIRRRENREAIGGMRNPRTSLARVRKHEAVGRIAFKAISQVLLSDTSAIDEVFNALGDRTKTKKGPSEKTRSHPSEMLCTTPSA